MKFLKIIGFIFLAALIFWLTAKVIDVSIYKIFWQKDSDYISQMTGSFFGAFFAALFALTGWWFKGLIDRQRKSFDAMVRGEHLLNNYLTILGDNKSLAIQAQQTFKSGITHILNIHKCELNREIPIDFTNIGLVNEFANLNVDLSRLNSDGEVLMNWVGKIENGFLSGKLNKAQVDMQFLVLADKLDEYKRGVEQIILNVKKVLCSTRVLLHKERPLKVLFFKTSYARNHSELVQAELAKLTAEIVENNKSKN